MRKKVQLSYLVYCLLVILPIYQDSPLNRIIGVAGNSVLPALSLFFLLAYTYIRRRLSSNWAVKELIRLGIWLFIVSVAAIPIWCLFGNSIYVLGEFLPIKAVKVVLQYFAYLAYISLLIMFMRKIDIDMLFKPIVFTLILTTIICLIELWQMPYAFKQLHSMGEFPYYRIRLLTRESSTTALIVYNYVSMTLYYAIIRKKTILFIVSMLCGIVLISSTGSKILLFSIAITLIIFLIISLKKMNKFTLFSLILVIFGLILYTIKILPNLIIMLMVDINNYTSVATRFYTILLGLIIGCIFPLGVGGAVYLGILPMFMRRFLEPFSNLVPNLNLSEVITYMNRKTDQGVAVKSGIFHYNMYWGILGTIYLFWIFYKLYTKLKKSANKYKNILISIFWTNILLVIVGLDFSYEFWLLITILLHLSEVGRIPEECKC